MESVLLFSLLSLSVVLGTSELAENETNKQCPTWYNLNWYGKCKCGSQLGGEVICERYKRVRLFNNYCMTYDVTSNVTVAGACPFSRLKNSDGLYTQPPMDVNELNNFTCGKLQRSGLLCSHCENSLGVAVLSYSNECTKCLGNIYGWLLYFTLALLPTTVFFIMVVYCRIHATAAHMNALICVVQILLYDVNSRFSIPDHSVMKAFLTIVGVWNLDFFRYIYPPFCISIHFSTLQVLAFEYIIAFYPLLLIIITYIGIELYDKNYRVIVLMWKPFSWCLSQVQKYYSLDLDSVKYSIINAFASFFVLSYSKILFTCYRIFSISHVFRSDGSLFQDKYFVLYNSSIPYVGPQHKPYFISAIAILTLFNILPMLLLFVYPTKIFQKVLGNFTRVRWHFLHVFMDSFQGCYKNGTNNTWDCRYFAGIYLLIRFVNHTPGIFSSYHTESIRFFSPLIAFLLFGVFRPYKKDKFNSIDSAYFGVLALAQILNLSGIYIPHFSAIAIVLQVISFIPVVHTLYIFSYCIILSFFIS